MDRTAFFIAISWQDSILKVVAEYTCLPRDNPPVCSRKNS